MGWYRHYMDSPVGDAYAGGFSGRMLWTAPANIDDAPGASLSFTFNPGITIHDAAGNNFTGFQSQVPSSWTFTLQAPTTVLRGSAYADHVRRVRTDSSGNHFVVGITYGELDGVMNAGGNGDIFVSKFSSDWTFQWTKIYGTTAYDEALDVAFYGSDLIVAGMTGGDLNSQTNAGGRDAFVMRLDVSGNHTWTRLLGTSGEEAAVAVVCDGGGIVVFGDTSGDLNGQTNNGQVDVFVAGLSAFDGTLNVTLLTGTSGDDHVYDAIYTSSYYYFVGSIGAQYQSQTFNGGSTDAFQARCNGSLSMIDLTPFGGPGDDACRCLCVMPSYPTSPFMAGTCGRTMAGTSTENYSTDDDLSNNIWVAPVGNGQGGYVWGDNTTTWHVSALTYGENQDFFLGGYRTNPMHANARDNLVIRFDPTSQPPYNYHGKPVWQKTFGTTVDDEVRGLTHEADGGVRGIGATLGNLDGQTNHGDYDISIFRYNLTGSRQ